MKNKKTAVSSNGIGKYFRMKNNLIRKIIGGLCFTSVIFVFQACYGTGPDNGLDVFVEGQVISKNTGLPVEGIKVSVVDKMQYTYSLEDGKFQFYTEKNENMRIRFEDVDSLQNLSFNYKDTLLKVTGESVYLTIELEEK